jgi:hypothetical protein
MLAVLRDERDPAILRPDAALGTLPDPFLDGAFMRAPEKRAAFLG